jgi:hypothetical protein
MQYTPELFWNQSGTTESMADDLRLAHRFMDLSENTPDYATARDCYEKAHAAHAAVDRLLRRNLPAPGSDRTALGAAIARLRSRLAAYESRHS